MPEPRYVTGMAATMTVVAMALGYSIASGDLTILSGTISVVRRGLQFSSSTTSFVAGLATLTLAATVLGAGALGDAYGMKRMYVAGACGVVFFGSLAAAAPTVGVLMIARAGIGVGFAFLVGLSLAIINAVFPPGRRAGAIAAYLGAGYALIVFQPVLGSLLVEHFGWRTGFLVAPALALLTLVITARYVPETPRAERRIDAAGLVLIAAALLGGIYGISRLQGGLHTGAVVPILLGVTAAALFVVRELRIDHPALDLRLFASPRFNAAVGAGAASSFVQGGSMILFAYYLVIIRGESPQVFALLLIPATLLSALAANGAGRAAARFGERAVLVSGLTVLVAAMLLRLLLDLHTPILVLEVVVALTTVGAAIVGTPQATVMMSSAAPELGGVVSAVRTSVGQTAYSLGPALFALVGIALFVRDGTANLAGSGISAQQARDTLRAAHGASVDPSGAGPLDPDRARWVVSVAAHSMIEAIHTLSLIMAVVPAAAIVAALVLLGRTRGAPTDREAVRG